MAFCIDENPVSSLKTTLQNIIHPLVFLQTSSQTMSSKNSNHEMTWLNPQLQNFHFYQSDKFSAKSLSWQARSSQCWRLSWCFFCVSCWTGCISFFYHFKIKSSLKCFMHTMEFLIGFLSDRLSHLIHFFNKLGLLKRKPKHLLMFLVISRVATMNQRLINHFTTYSCKSMQYV